MHDDCDDCGTRNSINFSGNMSRVNVKFKLVIKNNTKVSVSCSGVNKCSVEIVITIVVGCTKVKVFVFNVSKFQMPLQTAV